MARRNQIAVKRGGSGSPPAAKFERFAAPIGLAAILLATFLVYRPALDGATLWDDEGHITKPELQSVSGLYRIWFELGATQQYYPLLHSAFWIEHKLWGDDPRGYHVVNVLWHMLSVVLLYLILARLKIPGALLAAAIFAVHPVMVESVAWISEQKNTLSAVFYLSAMLVYLRFDESRQLSQYLVALVLFTLGLLTKTVIATLPAALLVIFWWQRGALSWKRDVLPLAPFLLLGAVGGLTTAWVERTLIGAEGADFALSLLQRGLLAGRVIWFYLGKLIWPANLTFIYPRWTIDPTQAWQWMFPIAAVGVTVGLWLGRKRWRGPLAGWLLFVGTLFPVLGFLNVFPFIFSFVADHFQYLASVAMIVLAAAGIATAASRLSPVGQYAIAGVCVAAVGMLAVLSFRQTYIYVDKVTLYQATLGRNPDCWMAHNNLGEVFSKTNPPQAIAHYEAALRLRPDYPQAHNNLGFEFTRIGRAAEAIEHIEEAIRLRPDFVDANLNLAIALQRVGRTDEAIAALRRFLVAHPDNAEARSNLGNMLIEAGRVPEGIAEFQFALRQKPDEPLILNSLGIALMFAGRAAEAIEPLQRAVSIKPDYFQARNSLGLALASVNRLSPAREQFASALQINPNYANAHSNLADVLVRLGDMKNAIEHYRRAIQIRPELTDAQYRLAVALTQSGKPAEAIEHYETALRFKPDDLQSYASLAQTLALLNRSQEAVATAQKGIEVARTVGKQDELKQFESWLKDYSTKGNGTAEETAAPAPLRN
jgi:protein O-mannosyl-transferase